MFAATDLAWVKYPLAAIVVTVFLALLGLIPMLWARRSLPEWGALLTPLLGMAWISIAVSWYGYLHLGLSTVALWLLALAGLAGVLVLVVRRYSKEEVRDALSDWRPIAATGWDVAAPWLAGIAVISFAMVPIFVAQPNSSGFLTAFTLDNNDLGTYVAQATNLAKDGFGNAGLYYHYDPGTGERIAANIDHTGAQAWLAAVASILGDEVWKTAQIALIATMAGLFTAAVCLARALIGPRPKAALVLGAVGAGNLLALYLAGHFFAAQVLCMVFLVAQIALVIAARDRLLDPRVFLTLAPMGTACLLSSPELQIIAVALMGIVLTLYAVATPGQERKGALIGSLGGLAAGTGVTLLLAAPFIPNLITRVQEVSELGTYGWLLDLHDAPLAMVGYPTILGAVPTGLGTAVIVVLAGLLVLAFALVLRRTDRQGIAAGIFTIILIIALVAGTLHWGFTTYQTWKLIMTLSVPLIVGGAVLLMYAFDSKAVLALCVAVALVNVTQGAIQWRNAANSQGGIRAHAVTNDLATFLASPRLKRQPTLNIDLPEQFTTLIAPAVFGRTAAMSSPAAANEGREERPYPCTLTDRTNYRRELGKIVYRNNGYLLVATPNCK